MTVGEPFWNCTGDYLYIIFRLAVVPGCISELYKLRILACLYVLLFNSLTPQRWWSKNCCTSFRLQQGVRFMFMGTSLEHSWNNCSLWGLRLSMVQTILVFSWSYITHNHGHISVDTIWWWYYCYSLKRTTWRINRVARSLIGVEMILNPLPGF